MEPLGQLFLKRFIAKRGQLGLVRHVIGQRRKRASSEFGRDGHDPGGGNVVPPRQQLLGCRIDCPTQRQRVGFLETHDRIAGGGTRLAIDHAGGEAEPVKHHLRLHQLARLIVCQVGWQL